MAGSPGFSWFKTYCWSLFALTFIYVILRALFVAPLHDESATFLHFIEMEKVIGDHVILDANNHLLNSFLGSVIHHLFGDNFFLIRLPNVLCFPVYFWGVYQFVKQIDRTYFKIILLTAMVSVAYMNDYFGYTRGYGMAMAFFMCVLVFAQRWVQEPNGKHLALLYFFSWIAVFANLTLMVSACLVFALAALVHLKNIKVWSAKKQFTLLAWHLAFLVGLYPFLRFGSVLRKTDALYYGSMDGFWEVTGKTLTKYVLHYDADWQKWLLLLLIVAFGALLVSLFIKRGFWTQLKARTTILGWFFFGNIAAIFILAKFMQVNYPEDRAGMYFIPLAILIFGFCILKSRYTRPLVFLLLFFPASFMAGLNLDTSVFTPDERLSNELYDSVKKELNKNSTISIYHTMQLNWAMHERKSEATKIQANINNTFMPQYDVIVNKDILLESADLKDYKLIHADKPSGISAYKRKNQFERILVKEHKTPNLQSDGEYLGLLTVDLNDSLSNDKLVLHIGGDLNIASTYRDVQFIISTFDQTGQQVRYEYYDQRWIHGSNKLNFSVSINHLLGKLSPEEKELRLYIWNPQHSKITYKNGNIQFYKLKE